MSNKSDQYVIYLKQRKKKGVEEEQEYVRTTTNLSLFLINHNSVLNEWTVYILFCKRDRILPSLSISPFLFFSFLVMCDALIKFYSFNHSYIYSFSLPLYPVFLMTCPQRMLCKDETVCVYVCVVLGVFFGRLVPGVVSDLTLSRFMHFIPSNLISDFCCSLSPCIRPPLSFSLALMWPRTLTGRWNPIA